MLYFFETSIIISISFFLMSLLFGSMIFFAIVVAPTVFKTLDEKSSRIFIRNLFPKLYMWGIILSLLNIIFIIKTSSLILLINILILFGFVISRQFLMKKINIASDESKKINDDGSKFRKLHSLSVLIFVVQLILILFHCILVSQFYAV